MNLGIIQARMGSSRLPGKMMMPLDGTPTIRHMVRRVSSAASLDEVVVATSEKKQDDIIDLYASRAGATVYRGSEEDVLGRMFEAAQRYTPDVVVRLTGDCPLLPPECIDAVVSRAAKNGTDYASTVVERTFPRGCGAEAFTFDSFAEVEDIATKPYHREHVTPYYRENPDRFNVDSVTSAEIFTAERYQNRTELRLTLDEAADYELLNRVYQRVSFESVLDIRDAIDYIDDAGIAELNADVEQITLDDLR